MIRAMKSGADVNLFTDEFRTPVSGKDAAGGVMIALERLPDVGLKPCRQVDLTLPAPRPADVSLDSTRAKRLGFQPVSLKAAFLQLQNPASI